MEVKILHKTQTRKRILQPLKNVQTNIHILQATQTVQRKIKTILRVTFDGTQQK